MTLIPERFALAMLEDGWIVRSRLAGVKIAPMPESVTDRPTSAWEHVYLFSKSRSYYWDQEAVRSDYARDRTPEAGHWAANGADDLTGQQRNGTSQTGLSNYVTKHAGANLRNWFYWPPASFAGAHFATWPTAVPELFIKAATSQAGQCAACGAPWRRVVERAQPPVVAPSGIDRYGTGDHGVHRKVGGQYQKWLDANPTQTTGWAPACQCSTDLPPVPQLVLDPFSGAGTTCLVANRLGRRGLGLELNPDYAQMARDRIQNDAPLCHAIAAAPSAARQGGLGL